MAKAVLGVGVTSAGLGGNSPQFNRTGYVELREKRLFYSKTDAALLLPKTFRGGYGQLEAGTVMAEETATGLLVPCPQDTLLATDVGRIMLISGCNAAATFTIWREDSGKIKSGDVIVLTDGDNAYEQATVSTVAPTADERIYTVTLSAVTTGNFETAKSASCYLKAGTTGKLSTAKYILDQEVYTGDYTNPSANALGSVFISHGIVYKDALVNYDSTAATALGGITDGIYVIFK